jgi:hypothetical protein
VATHLHEEKKQRISWLEAEVTKVKPTKTLMDTVGEGEMANKVTGLSEMDSHKAELDELVASECLLCGDVMIKSVTLPFFDKADTSLSAVWAL